MWTTLLYICIVILEVSLVAYAWQCRREVIRAFRGALIASSGSSADKRINIVARQIFKVISSSTLAVVVLILGGVWFFMEKFDFTFVRAEELDAAAMMLPENGQDVAHEQEITRLLARIKVLSTRPESCKLCSEEPEPAGTAKLAAEPSELDPTSCEFSLENGERQMDRSLYIVECGGTPYLAGQTRFRGGDYYFSNLTLYTR